jgi:hypothetical protein
MHPIERLRYVARASGAPQDLLVQETARALTAFGDDPQGLVTACRRIVSRQPTSGPLVWFTARVLCAGDARAEIWAASGELAADRTAAELAHALPDDATVVVLGWPDVIGDALPRRGDLDVLVVDALGEGSGLVGTLLRADADADVTDVAQSGLGAAAAEADLVVLEATAVGPSEFLAMSGSRAAAAVARHAGIPVWLVAGVGRLLPLRMWEGFRSRLDATDPWEGDDEIVPLDLVDCIVGPDGPQPADVALRRVDCPVVPELFKGDVF